MTAKAHAKPPMTAVKSSALTHWSYDPASRKMRVRFHSGKTWEYDDVSLERVTAFEGAASKGRYFSDQIKSHHLGREVFDG